MLINKLRNSQDKSNILDCKIVRHEEFPAEKYDVIFDAFAAACLRSWLLRVFVHLGLFVADVSGQLIETVFKGQIIRSSRTY
jgi:hypothetical protein